MKLTGCCIGLIVLAMTVGARGQDKKPAAAPRREPPKPAPSAASPDEQAIRATAQAFVKAFHAQDAKALAALWTANADYLDERGQRIEGRQAIEKEYAALFEKRPGLEMKLDIDSLRMLSATTAVEDGRSTLQAGGRTVSKNRYTAIHVKEGGRWLLASVRDLPDAEDLAGGLSELEFFIGDWVARRDETTVKTTCKWAAGKRFLLRTYTATSPEHPDVASRTGLQVIGWDPASRQIRSWTFDSTGGHGQGVWRRVAGGWAVESQGVLADGDPTSSTELIEQVNDNVLGWQSVDRMAGGEPLPDTEQVVLERVPAGP